MNDIIKKTVIRDEINKSYLSYIDFWTGKRVFTISSSLAKDVPDNIFYLWLVMIICKNKNLKLHRYITFLPKDRDSQFEKPSGI